MRCCVGTTLAVLCLTAHLPIGAGQANSQASEVTGVNIQLPQRDINSTRTEDITVTNQADITVTTITPRQNISITTHQTSIIPTHEANTSITPQENGIPHEDITTTPHDAITTPEEDIANTSLSNTGTPQEGLNTSPGSDGEHKPKTTVMTPVLEDGHVPKRVDQLVICSCPDPTPDGCRRFLSHATIDSKDEEYEDTRRSLADLNIVVHNVTETCIKKDYRFLKLSEGQFYYRVRGDIVLTDTGYLTGLRVNDYCAEPYLDEYEYLKWNMNICIVPPSVPRCCPHGLALKDGVCKEADTPTKLEPPLSAGLDEGPIYWEVTKEHYNPLTCTKDPLTSVPLIPQESYLLAVPDGIMHIWRPGDGHVAWKYTYAPNLCIDGYVDSYGSVVYSANICYSYPEELHRRVCFGHTCVRKCCPDGEEMSLTLYRCIPSNFTNYEPPFTVPPDDYRIVHGKPLCPEQTLVSNATVNSRGQFHFVDEALSPREYCVDKFSDGRGEIQDMAMVCIKVPAKGWVRIRKFAFPICQIISEIFLLLTVACYFLVPELLQGGGWYQLFHVLSLMVGYASMFAQKLYSKTWEKKTCFIMGIVLQFGFLSTFFWLNVLCFEVWRKIRSLNKLRPASVIPIWVYLLYAFGVPTAIGILTVCLQFYAPDDVPGLIKPKLGRSRCFFAEQDTRFLYFYGPIAFLFALNTAFIAHTYWTYRKFEENSSVLKKNQPNMTGGRKMHTEYSHRKRDYISDFKQQFSLMVLMSTCWITEVLSSVIPPLELWAATDLLNTLQGFFIFVIFIANRSKRKHLRNKFPQLFKIARHIKNVVGQCFCRGDKASCLAPLSSFTSQVSRKLSSSSVVSNLSTLSTSLKFSTSSFSITIPDNLDKKRPSVFEPDGGITILSHSSLKSDSVSSQDNFNTQC